MNSDEARARAETAFKKEQQAREGTQAWLEYQAQARASQEKTARLRALRLAKEAADKATSPISRSRLAGARLVRAPSSGPVTQRRSPR
jgi:hypothetical protein